MMSDQKYHHGPVLLAAVVCASYFFLKWVTALDFQSRVTPFDLFVWGMVAFVFVTGPIACLAVALWAFGVGGSKSEKTSGS
jgi:hypothetical protein